VSFVNNAWVAREWNHAGQDTAAVSTSWYTVPAHADDWMITPAIFLPNKAILSWTAFASDPDFRDGYEVRISTAGPNINDFTTILFSTGAEQVVPTKRIVDLQAYAGMTIFLAFRNNSFNKNLLFIDNIKVELKPGYDASIFSAQQPSNYTLVPRSQRASFIPSVVLVNNGINTLNNLKIYCSISRNNTLIKIDSGHVFTLGSSLSASLSLSPFLPTDTGLYEIVYCTKISQTDENTSNDTIRYSFYQNDTVYARDDGTFTGKVSIGATSVEYGHTFQINHPAKATSATVFLHSPNVGATVRFRLYVFGNSPQGLVDSTFSYTTTLQDSINGKWLTLEFVNKVKMQQGRYLLAVLEQGGKKLNVGTSDQLITARSNWFRFSGNPFGRWASGDEYDSLLATQLYSKTMGIRLNVENACLIPPDFTLTVIPTCTNTGEVKANFASENPGPYLYLWSNGKSTKNINNLSPGTYTVTVTDNFMCRHIKSATVSVVPININIQVKDVSCKGGNNGEAKAICTGGNGNYTYKWNTIPIQNTQTAVGLKKGIYTVTVSDGSCTSTATAPVLEPETKMEVQVIEKIEPSSPQANDGKIAVTAINGQPPYQYLWSDSSVQPILSNIGPGRYCVTVTDERDCVAEICETIGTVDIKILNSITAKIYPNPVSDIIFVDISNDDITEFALFDITGKIILSRKLNGSSAISVEHASPGIYVAELKQKNYSIRKRIYVK
ncbi:MAG: T9SS type A sorting domain-containing protein, partial [Chitinophagales bacterium]|nr:T9SS type A sorting domain-containing protein [Chitinophagales bacterium]